MRDTHAALTRVRKQVDRAKGSLASVMSASPRDLRDSFDDFSKDVDALGSDADETKRGLEKLKAKKHDYLKSWNKDRERVKDDELRQIAELRHAEVSASLDRAVEALQSAKDAFNPFLGNLRDVRKVLGNDLTANGQSLVAGTAVVQNANDEGADVARSIDAALVEIEYVARQVSPTGSMK